MILSKQKLPTFDPANHEHRAVYAEFLKTGNFRMKFYIEVPRYHNMLDMMRAKLAEHACREETAALLLAEFNKNEAAQMLAALNDVAAVD